MQSPELGMRSLPKPLKVTVEQPSPVSVLDVAFDEDESPSPVRKISVVFKGAPLRNFIDKTRYIIHVRSKNRLINF